MTSKLGIFPDDSAQKGAATRRNAARFRGNESVFWQKSLGTPDLTPEKELVDLCRTHEETSAGKTWLLQVAAWDSRWKISANQILRRDVWTDKLLGSVKRKARFLQSCRNSEFSSPGMTPRWFLQQLAADLKKKKKKTNILFFNTFRLNQNCCFSASEE